MSRERELTAPVEKPVPLFPASNRSCPAYKIMEIKTVLNFPAKTSSSKWALSPSYSREAGL
jgi:hypothetical protein